MEDLEKLREEVDKCDKGIILNFIKRMEVVEKIAQAKKETDKPILNENRECEIIDKIRNNYDDFSDEICELYKELMRISRNYQKKKLFSKNIFLIGFMGTGKSTVGKALSEKLGFNFIDMDDLIEKRENQKITDIFKKKGEKYFREIEKQVLKEVEDSKNTVIACGGGIILDEENRQILKVSGTVILLKSDIKEIFNRIKDDNQRPLFKRKKGLVTEDQLKAFEDLLSRRQKYYDDTSEIEILVDGKQVDHIAMEIIGNLSI